jgi:hypothetical protein
VEEALRADVGKHSNTVVTCGCNRVHVEQGREGGSEGGRGGGRERGREGDGYIYIYRER